MRLTGNKKLDKEAVANRKKFFQKKGINLNDIVSGELVHKNGVAVVKSASVQKMKNSDALVTDKKGIFLTITVADCLPLYFFGGGAVGIAHCGWRSIAKNIIKKVVRILAQKYKIKADRLKVEIGPHIRDCHFEVRRDLIGKFKKYPDAVRQKNNKKYFNLSYVARKQLEEAGVKKYNIKIRKECTYCENKYFSYRRDGKEKLKTMIAYIGNKK